LTTATARIVLATADGLGTAAIMRTAGVSKTAVWRWQARFMEEGVPGLLHDKTRPARVPKRADEVAERIVALTLGEPLTGPAGCWPRSRAAFFFDRTRARRFISPTEWPGLHGWQGR
jgi:hypothetical protein